MSAEPIYPYAQGDLLERRNSYFYSPYGGPDFVTAWSRSRLGAARELADDLDAAAGHARVGDPASELFRRLRRALASEDGRPEDTIGPIACLIQRFEVSKRVYAAYDAQFRPTDADAYRALHPYVEFAELLDSAYQATHQIQALNALLKCLDILVAYRTQLEPGWRARVGTLIAREAEHVAYIAGRVGVRLPC